MAHDDWRIRIELPEEGAATRALERLGLDLDDDARDLAKELEGQRLAVSRDDNEIFVYAASRMQAERARQVIAAAVARERAHADIGRIEHWLADEERWDDEPPGETWEEETLERGYAPWEVRVACDSRREAEELADRLQQEGHSVVRRAEYVIAGVASEDEARQLARRLHGEAEPGGELVYEVQPQNPFAIFGGLGGSGTPL